MKPRPIAMGALSRDPAPYGWHVNGFQVKSCSLFTHSGFTLSKLEPPANLVRFSFRFIIAQLQEAKMRQKPVPQRSAADKTFKDIRRATRKHCSGRSSLRSEQAAESVRLQLTPNANEAALQRPSSNSEIPRNPPPPVSDFVEALVSDQERS